MPEQKPDMSRVFATIPLEQLENFVSRYEEDAGLKTAAANAPPELRDNLNNCPVDFLHGYMLGSLHTSNTITLIHDYLAAEHACLAAGNKQNAVKNKQAAAIAEARTKVLVYLACKRLRDLVAQQGAIERPTEPI